MRIVEKALVCLILASASAILFGQEPQAPNGTNIVAAGGVAPDLINLNTLGISLPISIRNKSGRGTSFTAGLLYNSLNFAVLSQSGSLSAWIPSEAMGWSLQTPADPTAVLWSIQAESCATGSYEATIGISSYRDQNGIIHPFATGEGPEPLIIIRQSACANPPYYLLEGFPATASDGSGYTINYLNNTSCGGWCVSITSPSGAVSDEEVTGSALSTTASELSTPPLTTLTDRNGNQISSAYYPENSSGTSFTYINGDIVDQRWTDTLGQDVLDMSGSTYNSDVHSLTTEGYTDEPLTQYGTLSYPTSSGTLYEYTPVYKTYSVLTSFGCSGIVEYSNTSMPLLDHITLPDGRQYQFTYQPTSSGAATVTGLVSQVTLPGGGSISYQYSGFNCNDAYTGLTRTVNDGQGHSSTWTYETSSASNSSTTTIKDPTGASKVISYELYEGAGSLPNVAGGLETSRLSYDASGTLLATSTTSYSYKAGSGIIYSILIGKTVTDSIPNASGISSESVTTYNPYGMITEQDMHDFGAVGGGPGALLTKTVTAYPSTGLNYMRPASVTTYDGVGNVTSQEVYTYDQGTPNATSGTPAHSTGTNSGNLTTLQHLASGSSSYLTSTYTYNDTGTLYSTKDVNGEVAYFSYNQCGNSFLGSTTETILGVALTSSSTWDCYGGVPVSSTDVNGNTTTTTYDDPFWRPTGIVDPLGNSTTTTFPTASSNTSSVSQQSLGGLPANYALTTYDGLGDMILSQTRQGSGSTNYTSIARVFDPRGLMTWSSVPYSASAGSYLTTGPGITTAYDGIGRKLSSIDGGGGTLTYTYNLNDILVTKGPAVSGENAKSRQLQHNGLGELTSVCEITSGSGSGSCGQNTTGVGYQTIYTYDANNLVSVSENSQGGTYPAQARTLSYDKLGRKIAETIPETGTSSLVYDSDPSATCSGSSPGDLIKFTDNAGNITCYTYDGLHRRLNTTVVAGPYASVTPQTHFVYDTASLSGVAMQNAKGNVAEAYTCTGTCATKLTDIYLTSYAIPQTGQSVNGIWEATPNSTGYYHTQTVANANGSLASMSATLGTTSIGFPTVNYSLDSLGRLYTATDSTNTISLVTSTSYNNLSGAVTGVTFGNGDTDSYGFDPATNRPTSFAFSVGGSSPFAVSGSLTWSPNASLQNFSMTDTSDATKNQNCTYHMDDINRLASVNCVGSWAQTFSYDPFGNIAKGGPSNPTPGQITQSYQAGYNSLNNQANSGVTAKYDANGNQTLAETNDLSWNATAQPVNVNGIGATYDAFGRLVETASGTAHTQYIYSPGGHKIGIVQGAVLIKGLIPLPGGDTAVYNGSGLSYFRHKDWLGSSRLATTWTHAVYSKEGYAPFGETYNEVGTPDRSFTGQDQDAMQDGAAAGIFDFLFRKYDPVAGRWLSPDPAGWNSVSPSHPQSLNRYAYVQNNPLSLVDPDGQACVYNVGGAPSIDDAAVATSDAGCAGGVYVPGDNVQLSDLTETATNSINTSDGQLFNTYTVDGMTIGVETGAAPSLVEEIAVTINISPTTVELAQVGLDVEIQALPVIVAPEFELGEVAVEAVEASDVVDESVIGYRAVAPGEYGSIADTGQFSGAPSGTEVKYFSDTVEQTTDFGDRMYGPGNYGVVQGEFPTSAIGDMINPATEGSGFVVPNENLPSGIPTLLRPPY
jgi:RHS repeat-associated protein